MKHPNDAINKQQTKLLAEMSPEDRYWHERMFRVGNAAYCYHHRTKEEIEPSKADWEDWLEGLPASIQKDMRATGFEACKSMLPFTRHVMERNDMGMEKWMKEHLSKDDFSWWQAENM